METVYCQHCRKPVADRRRGKVVSAQPVEFDELTGVLVIVCAHWFNGQKCRAKTAINVVLHPA